MNHDLVEEEYVSHGQGVPTIVVVVMARSQGKAVRSLFVLPPENVVHMLMMPLRGRKSINYKVQTHYIQIIHYSTRHSFAFNIRHTITG
jgi:hypothetical protein